MTQLLMLAPPGAGKGTQGSVLAELYRVPHVATGEVLRSHVERGTPVGLQAAPYIRRGDLVPDQLVFDLVVERLTVPERVGGFVLDGFPRTLEQAVAARRWAEENGYSFSAVVHLVVPEEELVARLLSRAEGRSDDSQETIRKRLALYRGMAGPMLSYYASRGILVDVDGTGSVEEVSARTLTELVSRGTVPPSP